MRTRLLTVLLLTALAACRSAPPKPHAEIPDAGPLCDGGPCLAPVCGNGIVETGEQCDPGMTDSTSTCVSCQIVQCGGTTFQTAPAGTPTPFVVVGDFTVPTLDGDWNFRSHFTGCDSYVFVLWHAGFTYADDLWSGPIQNLLLPSPTNTHFFFVSYDSDAMTTVTAQQARVQTYLSHNSAAATAWKDRIHFVTQQVSALGNWLTDMLQAQGYGAFAIDRQQRLREPGYLVNIETNNPDNTLFAYQVQAFNFEFDREQALAAEQNVTVIPVITPVAVDGGTPSSPSTVDVELPPAEQMALFDTLEYDVTSGCAGDIDKNCPAWDQIGALHICSEQQQPLCGNGTVDMGEDCDPGGDMDTPTCTRFCEDPTKPLHVCNAGTEIGRWITTYARIGRWVTDDSQMLAAMTGGGKRRFQYNSGGSSLSTVLLRLRGQGGAVPQSMQYLWGGGGFDASYNMSHMPMTFTVPPHTSRVQFVAFVTGHGWGQDAENCAEFCDVTHEVAVNSNPEHVLDHPLAGTSDGCARQVVNGSIPNQYGTWPLGRDGWCPGLDVKPWVIDITSEVDLSGASANTITYEALFDGMNYVPMPAANPNSSGFGANITMSSYVVFSQ